MATRIERYGTWGISRAENIHFGKTPNGIHEAVIDLVIDDGVSSRGHRNNIFKENLKYLGVGIAGHTVYGQCVVVDYAGEITPHSGEDTIDVKEGVLSLEKFYSVDSDEETKDSDSSPVDTGDIPPEIFAKIKAMNLGSDYKVTKVGGKYQLEISSSGEESPIEKMAKSGKLPTGAKITSHTVTTTTTYTSSNGKKTIKTTKVRS